jgi:7-alpha-hydroxysteroid dehydrogenase
MSFSIAGKTAIVTGAANGLGLAIARQFADKGANVMFADMDEKRLIEELGPRAEEGNVRYFAGDLRERLTIANLISATIDAFDQIDILVNGARQILPTDPLDPDDDTVAQLLDMNMMPALRLSQQVARRMIKQAEDAPEKAGGAIISLSSIASRRAHPDLLGYSIASAALEQMTRSLAVSLAQHKIRVNAVAFGSVMSASLQSTLKENLELRSDIEKHTPLSRIASAAELADTVQFLACEGASFMTGQVLTYDGGRTVFDPVEASAH